MRLKMSKEDYENIFKEITTLAFKKCLEGFDKYGEGIDKNYDMLSEVEEEIADTINYLIFGLYKVRIIKEMLLNIGGKE